MPIRTAGSSTTVVVPPASRTATGNSGELPGYGPASELRVQLDVTAATGTTPTMDVVIEDSLDGDNWNTVATFTQATGVTREVVNVTAPFADRLRVSWTMGGTSPDFTFSVIVYGRK